jgi:hypothetical protein
VVPTPHAPLRAPTPAAMSHDRKATDPTAPPANCVDVTPERSAPGPPLATTVLLAVPLDTTVSVPLLRTVPTVTSQTVCVADWPTMMPLAVTPSDDLAGLATAERRAVWAGRQAIQVTC